MLEFTFNKTRDPDGSQLRRLLEAQLNCERMGAARSFLAHILAVTGAVIWVGRIWPNSLGSEIEFFALALFGGMLILALGIVVEEMIWRLRLKRRLGANEAVKPIDAAGPE
jgi:hypothetical protein